MAIRSWTISALVSVVLLAAAPDRASACSCIGPGAPCEAYASTPAVFVGLVSEIKVVRTKSAHGDFDVDIYLVRFVVEQALKGVSGREAEVWTGPGGGSCGYDFEVGEHYFVYAGRNDQGALGTSICSRTRKLADAEEDLAYIRSLSDPAARGRVVGRASLYRGPEYGSDANQGNAPLGGLRITLEGEGGRLEATTDADGMFELTGLKAGTYRLSAALPKTLALMKVPPVTVSGACAVETHLVANAVGAVTGRVVDHEDRPVEEMRVDLYRQEGDRGEPSTLFTDADGRFAFEALPAGRYILGANLGQPPDVERPYPTTYYPFGRTEAEAAPVELGDAERVDGLVLRLPERLRETTIDGVVVWPDGRPVAAAHVHLREPGSDRQREGGVAVGAGGRFSIRALVGERYSVRAVAEVEGATGGPGQMHAEPVTVTAAAEPKPLRLVISLPHGE